MSVNDFDTEQGFAPEDSGVAEVVEDVSEEEMTQDDEAMAVDADDQMPEAEPNKPPKGYVPQKDLDNLRSTYDRKVAETTAKATALEKQLQAIRADRDEIDKRMLALETQDMPEDQAALVRERYEVARERREAQQERQQIEAEKAVVAAQRAETVKADYAAQFAVKYGVPKQVLIEAETRDPHDMELVAKAYNAARRGAASNNRKAAGTDNVGSGQPTRTAPGSMQEADRRYAAGQISDAQYDAYRQKHYRGD